MLKLARGFLLPAAVLLAAGCSDSTGTDHGGVAVLRIQLTDAPAVQYDSAIVYIGAVTALRDSADPVLITDSGGVFNLLDLQNGVTAELGDTTVEPGRYHELRMIVDSARVVLAPGWEFEDGTITRSLKVPSGSSSGIKIKLSTMDGDSTVRGVDIVPGETVIVVEFDVYRNFKTQGNANTPAGLKGVIFTPTLRAVARNVAGSISGTVTSSADSSPLENLTVWAVLQGTADSAMAVTAADGTYSIMFLPPGTYDVEVQDFSAASQEVTVGEGEQVTGVDFSGEST